MTPPAPPMTFSMPMYRDIIPERVRPWIYLVVATCFQMSGGIYLAALSEIEGNRCMMREDCLMTLYMNMLGLAMTFPLLFRTKFRFTNKQLLCTAAVGVIAENIVTAYCDFLPLIWLFAFIGGGCKILGTFECMSSVQLWLTPQRDFRVFFPLLHIIVLGSICITSIVTALLTYYIGWLAMHWLIIALMLLCLLFFTLCLRSFHHIPQIQPFTGIDWLGMILLSAFFAQLISLLTYGDWLGWNDSEKFNTLLCTTMVTFLIYLWHTFSIEHPFIELKMWTYSHVIPILGMSVLFEILMASERVLEEIYIEEVMHYGMLTHQLHFGTVGIVGVLVACLFCYVWLYKYRQRLLPLFAIGVGAIVVYLLLMYFVISPNINIEQLYPAVFFRQFASATLSICFLVTLESIVGFVHFFQCLGMFQALHLCCGSAIGSAIYGEAFHRYISLNLSRYGDMVNAVKVSRSPFDIGTFMSEHFMPDIMAISLKTIYGWVIYAALFTLLLILLYDIVLKHRRLVKFQWIPSWKHLSTLFNKRTQS